MREPTTHHFTAMEMKCDKCHGCNGVWLLSGGSENNLVFIKYSKNDFNFSSIDGKCPNIKIGKEVFHLLKKKMQLKTAQNKTRMAVIINNTHGPQFCSHLNYKLNEKVPIILLGKLSN